MNYQGVLKKMKTELVSEKAHYYMVFEEAFLSLHQFLGATLHFQHDGYCCLGCQSDKPIYAQGYCKPCFFENPAAAQWVMKPELSTAHLGIAHRDLDYEKKVQLQPHVVYLALSSDAKVGITRKTQVPYRWIDQGAVVALPILEVENRYQAGMVEVVLKKHISDKTSWQKMLKNEVKQLDIKTVFEQIKAFIPSASQPCILDESPINIKYPVKAYPTKIKSYKLAKTPDFKGKLMGIKGQYLIFEDGMVFNVRGHEGFCVKLSVG